ncbi:MAG: nucleotide exchange factor GrpE [Verrucomicrobiales bacterium]
MSERTTTRIPKLPFYGADLIVSAIACYVLYRLGSIDGTYEAIIAAVCLAAAAWGAWLSILPWLTEFRAATKASEADHLVSVFDKLKNLDQVALQIQSANSNWEQAQASSAATVKMARDISEKMRAESEDFMKFFQNTNDQEKKHLRLELDKMKRAENDWLQVNVRILDHVFALHQAGLRTGQENLINQLTQFQFTCRDISRRVGLTAFAPNPGEPFDERAHQHAEPNVTPAPGTPIAVTAAPGYTFQGQLLRRALVHTGNPQTAGQPSEVNQEGGVQTAPEAAAAANVENNPGSPS